MRILFFTLLICFFLLRVESLPHISLDNEAGWKFSMEKDGIFSDKKINLKISCTSNNPIQWDFEGEFGETSHLWMPQISVADVNDLDSVTYKIIYDAEFSTNVSGAITCSHVETPSENTKLLVFVSLNSSVFLESEQTFKAKDFYGVACPVTNPMIPVYLMKVDETGNDVVVHAPFNPIRGFPLRLNLHPGRYFCRAGNVDSKETVEILRYKDLQLTPWADDMSIFNDESRIFQCNSTTQKVAMEVTPNIIALDWIHESEHSIILRLPPVKNVEKFVLSCFTPIAHHDWRITIIEPPTIHFDNNFGDVYCKSNSQDKYVQTLRCNDDNSCSFLSHCLDEGQKCNKQNSSLNVFYAKNNARCLDRGLETFPCVNMKLHHYNGIARCGIADIWRQQNFFISLNLNRYTNWNEAPVNEILRLNDIPKVLYANNTNFIRCEGSYYLFGTNVFIVLRYADGRKQLLPNALYEDYRDQKYEYSGVRSVNMSLPIDIVGIYCYAYFINTKEFVKIYKSFEMRYARAPYFAEENYQENLVFENGTYARIVCPVQGEEKPFLYWDHNDKLILEGMGSDYETSVTSKGHHVLEIPRVTFSHSGEYRCVAANSLGETFRKFNVQITRPHCSPLY